MSVGHIGQLCLYIKSHKALLTLTYSLTHVSVTERKRERGVTHTHPTVTSSPRLKWWRNWAQIGNLISVYLCLCGVCVCVCVGNTHTHTQHEALNQPSLMIQPQRLQFTSLCVDPFYEPWFINFLFHTFLITPMCDTCHWTPDELTWTGFQTNRPLSSWGCGNKRNRSTADLPPCCHTARPLKHIHNHNDTTVTRLNCSACKD